MTFQDIFEGVARRTDKNVSNPDLVTRTRIESFINDRYHELMALPGMIDLRDESFTFTSEANRARYVVPMAASSIINVIDQDNRIKLSKRPLFWIREQDPGVPAQTTGTSWVYDILNGAGVQRQPSVTTASACQVLSSSASDTSVSVEIEYQDADGGYRVIAVNLNGTTPVTVAATMVQVFRITATAATVGAVTLREIVSTLVLAVIPPASLSVQTGNTLASSQWVLHLWPTPSGAITYTVDGSRTLSTLANPLDQPLLPLDFHPLLVYGATEEELIHMDDTRQEIYRRRWEDGVKKLRAFLHQDRGERVIPNGRRRRNSWSPLGPNYPAFPG